MKEVIIISKAIVDNGIAELIGEQIKIDSQEVELLKMALDWSDWTGHRLKLKENLLKKLESLEEGRK